MPAHQYYSIIPCNQCGSSFRSRKNMWLWHGKQVWEAHLRQSNRDKINFLFILALNSTANVSQKHPGRMIILIQFPSWLCKTRIIKQSNSLSASLFQTVQSNIEMVEYFLTGVPRVMTGIEPWGCQKAVCCVWQRLDVTQDSYSWVLPIYLSSCKNLMGVRFPH